MTLELLRNEIWQQIGEPSDLDPTTDVQYAGGPLLTWVANEAQRQIATWKDVQAGGRITRLPQLVGELFYRTYMVSGSLTADGSANTIALPAALVGPEADRYNGWIVECNGEYKLIVDYAGQLAYVHEDWGTIPATNDTFTLYKRFSLMLPTDDVWATNPAGEHLILPVESTRFRTEGNYITILRVEDVQEQTELKQSSRPEAFTGNLVSVGTPSRWWLDGGRLWFDSAWEDLRWLRIQYYRTPTDMTQDDDEPEIPEQYHYGLVLWGCWWGFRRQQENASAYSLKRDFEDFMRSRVAVSDIASEKRFDYGSLRRK